jgi:hypothetical protein
VNRRLLLLPSLAVVATVACGGGSSLTTPTPSANTAQAVAPVAAPAATPAAPSPSPSPCTQGLCEAPTTNSNQPVRLTIKLYSIVDREERLIQGVSDGMAIPVGYRATIDATAKDDSNRDTIADGGSVEYTASDWSMVRASGGGGTHQLKFTPLRAGTITFRAEFQNVVSNELTLTFVE